MLNEDEKSLVMDFLFPLFEDENVLLMKKFIQHGDVTTYDHCLSVAFRCYEIARKNPDKVDVKSLLTAAMLHDFCLYDWHDPDPSHKWHGFHHAKRAADNARKYYAVSDEVYDAIYRHMWPLNPLRFPRNRMEFILMRADRSVALRETFGKRKKTGAKA